MDQPSHPIPANDLSTRGRRPLGPERRLQAEGSVRPRAIVMVDELAQERLEMTLADAGFAERERGGTGH